MNAVCPAAPVMTGTLVAVVGTGASGRAAARLLHSMGARVRIVDRNGENISEEFRQTIADCHFETAFGEHCSDQFAGVELVVPSPGVPVAKIRPFLPPKAKVMAEVELAWRCVQHIPALAVTGTNGKSTTVALCARMLEEAGKTVFLGGNFGTPLSEFVLEGGAADVLVLELSSFQLQTIVDFCPRVGVLLNVSEDHLDYHEDMREYRDAKMRIFMNQDFSDTAIFRVEEEAYALDENIRAEVVLFGDSGRFPDASLKGAHNRLNMEAAFLATRVFGVTEEQAARAVANFHAAPHTLETVCEKEGILYVNDSKATTVESVRAALESFNRPVLLLAGGVYKGGDLASLVPVLKQHVKAVGLFGQSKDIFNDAWKDSVPVSVHETMEDAARALRDTAESGDVLLLSPATSSFDQYANYKARGEDFRRIAGLLA